MPSLSKFLPPTVFTTAQKGQSYSTSVSKATASAEFDLCSPDGGIATCNRISRTEMDVTIVIDEIAGNFAGFNRSPVVFVLKSSLAQLGVNAVEMKISLDTRERRASVTGKLVSLSPLGTLTLDVLAVGSVVGKLFCPETHRLITSMDYIYRLLNQIDMHGNPLLVYGSKPTDPNWQLKMVDGRVVALLPVQPGVLKYSGDIHGLLPTIGKALLANRNYKDLLRLHQEHHEGNTRIAAQNQTLMVRSYSMHLRTMFGRVVDELLPEGVHCMSSNVIEPGPKDQGSVSGRTFVFYGDSAEELQFIPIEFFAMEAYREHVAFEQRTTLPQRSVNPSDIAKVFRSMPKDAVRACTYISTGKMFDHITEAEWVTSEPHKEPYVGVEDPMKQQELAAKYLFQQCEYGILSAISMGDITSDGVLVCRYFPSPVLKSLLLSRQVCKRLRAIIFARASHGHGSFLSQDDRSMLADLNTFGISVYQYDEATNELFQFMRRVGSDSGLMVPLDRRNEYLQATFFGVYGSNLVAGDFEAELMLLMRGLLELRKTSKHPKFNANVPLALVTGGGPGAMEVGNRVAKTLGVLSCGMFVDFGSLVNKPGATINEQKKNPYVEAYMTYRPEKLVERQSDFNLDFPIFLTGGVGTDFEYALEEVRRKVGTVAATPLILFGTAEHWGAKITHRFLENRRSGTIKGSEWLSNIPHVVSSGKQALRVLTKYFEGTLASGPAHPANDLGFIVVSDDF